MSRPCCKACLGCLFLIVTASLALADGFEWKSAVDGDFLDPSKWQLTFGSTAPPPRDGDSAYLNEAGIYAVTLPSGGILRNDLLDVSAGEVTLRRSSPTVKAAYVLERPAGFLDLDNGAVLRIGVPGYPLDVTVEDQTALRAESQLWITNASNFDADKVLLGSGGELTIESAATATIGTLSIGTGASSDELTAFVSVQGTATTLEAGFLGVGRESGQRGSLRLSDNASIFAESLGVSSGSRIDINTGTLSIGRLASSLGKVYFGVGGTLSIDSNVLLGPNGLNGSVNYLAPPNTLRIGGVGTLETNETLQMKGGTYEGGLLVVSPGATILSDKAEVSTVAARVQNDVGSRIEVTAGELRVGDASHVKGFYSNGTTSVSNGLLRIWDANEAVFDSGALVELGEGNASGTIVAQNGIALDLGADLVGYGTVDTPDNSSVPLINNGHILGNSASQRIMLTGYVKGFGTCDYCTIIGTDAPGMSTARVDRGSVDYEGTLEIEIGGTVPGSGFDQVNHRLGAGVAELGGTLDVALIGSFEPSWGDSFEVLTAQTVNGRFDSEDLPPLASPLTWAVDYIAHGVELVVTVSGDFDRDGDVDGADFLSWQRGDSPHPLSADDLAKWQEHYGLNASLLVSSAAVPEPTTAALLLCVIACGLMRRKTASAVH